VTPQRSDLPGVLLRGATDTAIAQPFSDPLSLAFYCQRVTKLRDHPVFQTASKMAVGDVTLSYLLFTLLHFAQFVLAIVVCALYGIDLDRARKAHASADGKLVYAEVVGGLSALTTLLYCIPYILRFALIWAWNLVLFILWIVLFGLFGRVCHQDFMIVTVS